MNNPRSGRLKGSLQTCFGATSLILHFVPGRVATAGDAFSFDPVRQGRHVASMTVDGAGGVWVGMQDWAVWNRIVNGSGAETWRQFTVKDGLGDNDAYAIATDKRGRVWVGHLNHGVSVYNGATWKNYSVLDGPQGERIFDIEICPTNGDVWIATDAGLSRYSYSQDQWSYFSRANGMTTDQVNSIAFARNGDIYCGTPSDGITLARAAKNYAEWKTVRANTMMPNRAKGQGLPSNIVNDVLVARGTADGEGAGFVYVATVNGLAWSTDQGATWQFVRGADWRANLAGRAKKVAPVEVSTDEDELLLQDWVTCLAEDRRGLVWVGHLRAGVEARDPRSMHTTFASSNKELAPGDDNYVRAMVDAPGVGLLLGSYGNPMNPGVSTVGRGIGPSEGSSLSAVPTVTALPAPFPSPATPPDAAQLNAMTARLKKLSVAFQPGDAAFLRDDWSTQGNWVGRYGRGHATLAAMNGGSRENFTRLGNSPDDVLNGAPDYAVNAQNGPHDKHGMVPWVTWGNTETRRALYNPLLGHRRHAEWNDLSNFLGDYPWEWDGPDLWVTVKVPTGMHRASLYSFNKDGQQGHNRFRDFPIELKRAPVSDPTFTEMPLGSDQRTTQRALKVLSRVEATPTLARARMNDFWGGAYKQFALCGPATFYFKVARNHSYGVLVSGVFLDPMDNPKAPKKTPEPLPWMNGIVYDAPSDSLAQAADGEKSTQKSETLAAAQALWRELDVAAWKKGGLGVQRPMRLQALRAAMASGASPTLLANWRWKLMIWNDADEVEWRETMERAFPNKIF